MSRINYGSRAERFAMRPLEKDRPINILEGAVRSGKTWCLHPKAIYGCDYLYRGSTYSSLSKIAREITGTQWSGPAFFGTRKKA